MSAYRQGNGPQGEPPQVATRAGERGAFDPGLIDALLRDHSDLRRIFGLIGGLARSGSAHDLHALLIDFKSRLEAHVLTENLRFYDWVEQSVIEDAAVARMVHNFRHEMDGIARTVVSFVKKYQSSELSPEQRAEFARDYALVGKALDHRLATEEDSLYRLYRPA